MNSSADLTGAIFQQFVRVAMRLPAGDCLSALDQCQFDYTVERVGGNRIMTICYLAIDRCCRTRAPAVRLDYTNICYEDLCDLEWLDYLTRVAHQLVDDICPAPAVNCRPKRACRTEPKCWRPKPCCDTTIITKYVKPRPEVIIHDYEEQEECMECVPVCKPCRQEKPPRKVIVRHIQGCQPESCQPQYYDQAAQGCGCSGAEAPIISPACTPTILPAGAVAPGSRPTPFSLQDVQFVDAQTAQAAGLVLAPVQFGAAGQV